MKRPAVLLTLVSLLLLAAGKSDYPTSRPPAELAAFVQGNTAFAFNLHRRLAQPGTNLFWSPYSVTAALALVQSGARGQTEQQIAGALQFPPPAELQTALARIRESFTNAGKQEHIELTSATGLWARQNYGISDEFLQCAREAFACEVQLVDFGSRSDALPGQINSWVSRQTRDKIENALLPGSISADMSLVFVNTLYFKGQWANRFPRQRTQTRRFRLSPEHSVRVPMMEQTCPARYAESDLAQMVELPYAGFDLSMIVLLPRQPDGLPELERQISENLLMNWLAAVHGRTVDLQLPRFNIRSRLPLGQPLSGLGMPDAFAPTKADFTGMTPRRPLWIAFLQQCAVVEVNEEGTIAAAATSGGLACSTPAPPATFHADHPFLFFIRDNRTGVILFLGRVANPAQP
jgi:serpin B